MRIITIEEHFTTQAVIQANADAVAGDVLRQRPRLQAVTDKLLELGRGGSASWTPAGSTCR